MKKKGNSVAKTIVGLVITIVAVPVIIVVVFIGYLVVDGSINGRNFDRMKTGVTKDGILRITDDGTDSLGSNWQIRIEGDAVELADEHEERKGFFTATQVRQVYDLKPVSAGNALVLVKAMNGGGYDYIDVYSVSVDENMQISYESRRTDCLFFHEKEAVLYRGNSKTDLTREEFSDLTWDICGEWSSDNVPAPEGIDELTRISFIGSDYYFDTDNGIVYKFTDNQSGDDCSAFSVDEWLMPIFRENFK